MLPLQNRFADADVIRQTSGFVRRDRGDILNLITEQFPCHLYLLRQSFYGLDHNHTERGGGQIRIFRWSDNTCRPQ